MGRLLAASGLCFPRLWACRRRMQARQCDADRRFRASRPVSAGRCLPQKATMNPLRLAAIVLIAAGALALLYGGFTYTQETHDVKLGPIEFSVKEKKTVNIPIWAGVGAIVAGGVLLVLGSKKG